MAVDASMLLAYQQEFATNWWHFAQQRESKFASFVTLDNITGESKRYQRLSSQTFQKRTGRREKNKVTDPTMDFRHLFNDDYSLTNVLDKIDKRKIGNLSAPESEWVRSHGFAYERLRDKTILKSLLGNAIEGEKPTDSVALDSTRIIANDYGEAAPAGFTEKKLLRMKTLLDKGSHLSMEPMQRVLACDPDDLVSLYNSISANDFDQRRHVRDVLDGKTDMMFKFKVVPYTEWDTTITGTTSTNRRIVGWIKGAVTFNEGGRESRITELDEQNFDLQVYSSAYVGGLRMEDALVVACNNYTA